MTRPTQRRPWYVYDRLVDDWVRIESEGGDLKMLKSLKILRAIIVNLGIVAIVLYAISQGGSPDTLGIGGLAVLAAYNGVELLDYVSLAQAIVEVSQQDTSQGGED